MGAAVGRERQVAGRQAATGKEGTEFLINPRPACLGYLCCYRRPPSLFTTTAARIISRAASFCSPRVFRVQLLMMHCRFQ